MEIKVVVKDFDHCRKLHCSILFAEQLFAVHLLAEHLSMTDSVKLEIK